MRALNIATKVKSYSERVLGMMSPYMTAPMVHELKYRNYQ